MMREHSGTLVNCSFIQRHLTAINLTDWLVALSNNSRWEESQRPKWPLLLQVKIPPSQRVVTVMTKTCCLPYVLYHLKMWYHNPTQTLKIVMVSHLSWGRVLNKSWYVKCTVLVLETFTQYKHQAHKICLKERRFVYIPIVCLVMPVVCINVCFRQTQIRLKSLNTHSGVFH